MRVGLSAPPTVIAFWAPALAMKRTNSAASAGWRVRRLTPRWAPPLEAALAAPPTRPGSGAMPTRPRTGEPAAWKRSMAYGQLRRDRKSTRLNSSHDQISYAVFCLKKKKKQENIVQATKQLELESTLDSDFRATL